jgi:hypothetical protein
MENNRLVLVNLVMPLILSFNLMQSSLKACTQRQTFTKPIMARQSRPDTQSTTYPR